MQKTDLSRKKYLAVFLFHISARLFNHTVGKIGFQLFWLHPHFPKTQMKSYASFKNSKIMQMISKCHQKLSGSLWAYEGQRRVKKNLFQLIYI
jgi:hypothetical protein